MVSLRQSPISQSDLVHLEPGFPPGLSVLGKDILAMSATDGGDLAILTSVGEYIEQYSTTYSKHYLQSPSDTLDITIVLRG